MQDSLILSQNGRTLTAVIACEIDHHTAKPLREGIDKALFEKKPELLLLDFSGVRFMDSSGIGLVMGRYRMISLLGGRLEVVNIPPALKKIFDLSGLGNLGVMK